MNITTREGRNQFYGKLKRGEKFSLNPAENKIATVRNMISNYNTVFGETWSVRYTETEISIFRKHDQDEKALILIRQNINFLLHKYESVAAVVMAAMKTGEEIMEINPKDMAYPHPSIEERNQPGYKSPQEYMEEDRLKYEEAYRIRMGIQEPETYPKGAENWDEPNTASGEYLEIPAHINTEDSDDETPEWNAPEEDENDDLI